MPNRKDLSELIASLSKSEKRYFKLNAERNSKGKSKQFIDLFDAIDKGKPIAARSVNPSVANNYLYRSILNVLNKYSASGQIEMRIAEQVDHAHILYKKGLANQSLVLLEPTLAQAENFEDHFQIQRICALMRSIVASHKAVVKVSYSMEEVLAKNLKAAKETELMARLRFVQYRFQKEVSEFSAKDPLRIKELEQILSDPIMLEVDDASSIRARLTVLHIWSQYHLLSQNVEQGLQFGKKVFDLCYQNQHRLYEGGPLLLGAASNYMVRCHRANDMNEVARVLSILESLKYKDTVLETKRLEAYFTHKLAYSITTGSVGNGRYLRSVEEELLAIGIKMNQAFLMLIYCLGSQYAFLGGDMRSALKWINRFLLHENRKHLAKNIAIAELFRLLIFHQQVKLELLEKELKAFEGKIDQVEYPIITEYFIRFFNRELIEGQDHVQHVNELREAVLTLKEKNLEREAYEFFPFDRWVKHYLK